jgi:hypothetical protein
VFALAGVYLLVSTFATQEPDSQPFKQYRADLAFPAHSHSHADGAALSYDHFEDDDIAAASSARPQNYTVDEWGLAVSGVDIKSHQIAEDGASVLLRTHTYVEFQRISGLNEFFFDECADSLLRLHRVFDSDLVDSKDADVPWWRMKAAVELVSTQKDNYHYFFLEPMIEQCAARFDLGHGTIQLVNTDRNRILEGI